MLCTPRYIPDTRPERPSIMRPMISASGKQVLFRVTYSPSYLPNRLEPHENDNTDVVLLGHSMGGILSAEVALMLPFSPSSGQPFRHHILGTISFDTPYLGMHPGVVISGIGSLFRPAPESVETSQAATPAATAPPSLQSHSSGTTSPSYPFPTESTTSLTTMSSLSQSISNLSSPSSSDPYYNPPFPNDIHIPERKGWYNILHFINKHSDGLTSATKQFVMSHLEFGGCLADWQGMKSRYSKLRSLEDIDDLTEVNVNGSQKPVRRIRFVNYYTASTGRPKKPKVDEYQLQNQDENLKPVEVETKGTNHEGGEPTPAIAVDLVDDDSVLPDTVDDSQSTEQEFLSASENESDFEPGQLQHLDSIPIEDDTPYETPATEISHVLQTQSNIAEPSETPEDSKPLPEETTNTASLPPSDALPPIPPEPTPPPPLDTSLYSSKDALKLAQKQQKVVEKAYATTVKQRTTAIKDRQKLLDKREKKAKVEAEKRRKEEEKEALEEVKRLDAEEKGKQQARTNGEEAESKEEAKKSQKAKEAKEAREAKEVKEKSKKEKPKRDKKFCLLPSDISGRLDKCWERVYMEGVDEVGAHCGLFFPGNQYEGLVCDVGARIEEWVRIDATRRAVFALRD
jgi:hypothetical protein